MLWKHEPQASVSTAAQFSQTFTSATTDNSMETQVKRFLLFLGSKSTKQCFHRVMVNGFEPIRTRVVSCLFYKYYYNRCSQIELMLQLLM